MQEELYLRKIKNKYEVFVKDLSDKSVPYNLEYPFKEVAVAIIYEDGTIDALRVTEKCELHVEYYQELMKMSERFASEIRKRSKIFNLKKETITHPLDNNLASDGIAVFHNLDIKYINEYGMCAGEFAEFFSYLPEENSRTEKLNDVLDVINKNYDVSKIVENVYDPSLGRCKRKEKENIR